MKTLAESNSVIQSIRYVTELKAKADYIREREKGKDLKKLVNKQIKTQLVNKVVVASAVTDRTTKIYNQTTLPVVQNFKMIVSPIVDVVVTDGLFQTISLIKVRLGEKIDVYKKEIYPWGTKYYYKNDIEIDETSFVKEMVKYLYN